MINLQSLSSAPYSCADYTNKAKALLRLAGAAEDIETRQLIKGQADVQLAAAKAAQAVRQ